MYYLKKVGNDGDNIELREYIRKLRNDENLQYGFVEKGNITYEQQRIYMHKFGNDYYVCFDNNDIMCGFIGCVDNDIRLAVQKEYQGKGIAKFMINFIRKEYPNSQAKIKIENIASIKAFEAEGFKLKYYIYEQE